MQKREWLVETAGRASQKRGLKNYAEDIAQDVLEKVEDITDEVWAGKRNKEAYIARIVINRANDLCHQDHDFVAITDNILASTPLEAMEAAVLLSELYNKLSVRDQALLDLIFEEYDGREIAERLGVEPATARKRVSRLREKLASMSHGKQPSFQAEPLGRKQVNPVL